MSFARRIATVTTLSLAAVGLGGLAAQPATAAGSGAELEWGISSYFDKHLTTQAFTDGATESEDGVVTFPGGVVDGASTRYAGTARYAFANPATGAELYSFAFSDLTLTVDAAGDGTIAADVAWTSPAGPGGVEDAVLTTFSTDDDWSDGSLTATPDWLGVAAANAYGDGKPVDGASWAVAFVTAVPSSINPFFYASGSASDAEKAPASFTATAAEPAIPAVTASTAYDAGAVTVDVSGSGFTAITEPGDMGIYVGLAPSGGLPDTSSQESMDQFADAEWVMPTRMADGTWSVTLDPASKRLDPRASYSVYTWQAHTHSNPSQDTETPVGIAWSKVGSASKLAVDKAPGKLVVTNGKAAGALVVRLTKGSATKRAGATMKKGAATVRLPKLATGAWRAVVTFTPANAAYRAATKTVTVRVR